MKIPFRFTKRALLLSGKDREKARIEYELKGEDRDRELLALEYDTEDLKKLKEYRIKKLEIDKKYNKISDMDYDIELCHLNINNKSENDVKIEELEILLKYNKINGVEFCKQKNDILGKPWVAIKTNPEISDDDDLEIEVAYNKTFIKKMKSRGLPGDTDDEIAEQWLKLFFMANLDDDDFQMFEENDDNNETKPSRIRKIDDKSTFIG